jgi:hypothetical protein
VQTTLFAVSRSFEGSRGKFETKRLFGKSLESRNGVRRVRDPACLSGQARDDDFQLVYARCTPVPSTNQLHYRARADTLDAGARSPTTDTLVLSLIRSTSFYVDQYNIHAKVLAGGVQVDKYIHKYMHNSDCHKDGYLPLSPGIRSPSSSSLSLGGDTFEFICVSRYTWVYLHVSHRVYIWLPSILMLPPTHMNENIPIHIIDTHRPSRGIINSLISAFDHPNPYPNSNKCSRQSRARVGEDLLSFDIKSDTT